MWTFAIGILVILGLVALLAGGRAPRRRRLTRAATVGAAGLAGLAAYAFVGEPGRADEPFAARADELQGRNPAEMSREEVLVRLQILKQERPDDPAPHYFTGQLLVDEGREEEALRAFQSALRRDGEYVPALVGMADAFVQLSKGEITREAAQLYGQSFAIDQTQVRSGFLAGLRFWRQGNREQARAVWDSMMAIFPEGDERRRELGSYIATLEAREAAVPDE